MESTPGGECGSVNVAAGPTDLFAGWVGDGDFDAVGSAGLVRRKQYACGEREARHAHRKRGGLKVVEDANERRLAVVGDDDLVAEDDVLKVHRGNGKRGAKAPDCSG